MLARIRLRGSFVSSFLLVWQVVPSRIGMAAPAMFIPPLIMNTLEQTSILRARPALGAPIMVRLHILCSYHTGIHYPIIVSPLLSPLLHYPPGALDWFVLVYLDSSVLRGVPSGG